MSTPTRRAVIAVAVAIALALTACGGGSGNTVNDNPDVALFTNAGSAVSVTHGSVAEYSIGGGDQRFVGYTASSSDTKVATVVSMAPSSRSPALAPAKRPSPQRFDWRQRQDHRQGSC